LVTTLIAKLKSSPLSHFAAAAATVLTNRPPGVSAKAIDRALHAVAPRLTDAERGAWIAALAVGFPRAALQTARCVAAFLGQCSVESGGFQSLEENLTYTAARLCQVWPSRFPNEAAAATCAGDPEKLANTVYANRLGNGGPDTGDGWRFRGRGLIQITGRAAYQSFAEFMTIGLDQAVDHAATRQGAVDSAVWYWASNHLGPLADAWSLDTLTQRINGGTNAAAERARLCQAALQAIGGS
jgi:putative chitinase